MSAAGAATFNDKIIATELDISGDVDIDGTLEADAITVDGTTLATYIRDTVGTNMLSSNTETGIAVTYDTSNDNIDFALEASQTVFTSITNTSLVVGRDADNDIDFATDNNIIFRAAGADQIVLKDGVLEPVTDDDVALGSTGSKRFSNLFLGGSITTGNQANIGGNLNLNGAFEIDVASGDPTIIFDTQGADKFHIAVDDSDSDNFVIKSGGTVGSGNGLKLDSSGNLTVDAAVTVGVDDTGHDVKFFGATAGSFLLWDESADALLLTDSTPIKLGDSGDLEIYHDGSNSIVEDTGTGDLLLRSNSYVRLQSNTGENMLYGQPDGEVTLYYDNANKFSTTASGVITVGTLNINSAYAFPTSDGSATQILQTDGSGSLTFVNKPDDPTALAIALG
jgi:hypothetical protein